MSSFRYRVIRGSCSFPQTVKDISDSSSGYRKIVDVSPETYFENHPVPNEEFTLTQQLSAGVPLQQIPCSHLLDDDHSINTFEQDEKILSDIDSQLKTTENN